MTPKDQERKAHIDAVAVSFREQITGAFNAAHAVEQPAGLTPLWQQWCAHYQVAQIDDQERQQVCAAQRPLRGAAAVEFYEVVRAIVKAHRIALKQINVFNASQPVEAQHEALMLTIERTEKELPAAYRVAVLPKQGGMFANVFAGYKPQDRDAQQPKAHALTCSVCGAPRLSERDFTCAYCGENMA